MPSGTAIYGAALLALLFPALLAHAEETAVRFLRSPYPLQAAGWGPRLADGSFVSRWANSEAEAAQGKRVTFSNETRLRFDTYRQAQLASGNDYGQALVRNSLGANLTLAPTVRTYAEIGVGSVDGRRASAPPSFQNSASLQQLFVDLRTSVGSDLVGVMAGRQEFADGPRQLISVSDGPNLHRTWNGVRAYAHGSRLRVGAFDLRATRLERGAFDERINSAERLHGFVGSIVVSPVGEEPGTFVDPFWFHTETPALRVAGAAAADSRDTFGLRVWGKRGGISFDWTVARQSGRYGAREVDAWALFGGQTVALSPRGWKPRLGARIDLASGGGAYGTGALKSFNQLYASSGYLAEGLFLSTSNLALVTPGLFVSPTRTTSWSLEYSLAQRLSATDAVYGGLMRAYAGTQKVGGHSVGGLLRAGANWRPCATLTLFADFEYLARGGVLRRAGIPSGSYTHVGLTFRH